MASSSSSSNLQPRRKFQLRDEIKCALARFKHQQSEGWRIHLEKSKLASLVKMYTERYLYVKGMPFEPVEFHRVELLEYLRALPLPEEKETATGRRLAQQPVFGVPDIPIYYYNYKVPKVTPVDLKSMVNHYQCQEHIHKREESHHPDGLGWGGGTDSTIECVIDVYSCLLRTHAVKTAYIKLLDILKGDKFSNLTSEGILFACLHLIIRGVAGSAICKTHSEWRQEQYTQDQLWKYTKDFQNGVPPQHIIGQYMRETLYHQLMVTKETKAMRISSSKHDHTKFRPYSVYWYTWYWGIFQKMSKQNQRMVELGVDMSDPEISSHPTMFNISKSMGESFMEGALSSPEFNQVLNLSRTLPEEVATKIDQVTKEREDSLKESAREILTEFKTSMHDLAEETLDKLVMKSKDIGQVLTEAVEPFVAVLESLQSLAENAISQINGFLKPMEGFSGINLSVTSILECLKYYIVYINTETTSLKMILVLLMMNALGITSKLFSWMLEFWRMYSSSELEGHTVDAEPTSFLDWLVNAPTKFMVLLGATFASMAKGAKLSTSEFFKLAKDLSDKMRSIHFISMGVAAFERLFDYGVRFWKFISEWISTHIFGRTPDRVTMARKVMKLILKIKYFNTEAGLNAVRMAENVRVEAEKLFPEWNALLAQCRDNPEYRQMYQDLERQTRAVKEVSDFVTRFRAVSNFQPTMFHVQLVGRPGIGKSTLIKTMTADLTRSLWPSEPKPSFYSMNMNLEFFDGYAGQRIMIADDVYKMNEPKHLTATIGLITNTPVILPMANLADKGVQLTSEVFLSTTNTAYPLGKDVLCMEAVHRRRHMLVDVTCDERVIEEGSGQFSEALFRQYYPGQDKSKFPHLKFGLMKPVPKEFGGAAETVLVGEDEQIVYNEYAKLLRDANFKVSLGHKELDPTFYFNEENLPQGFSYPARGWSYEQFMTNCMVRFRSFRGMEESYSTAVKYAHTATCLAEIDALLDQNSDCDGPEIPTGVGRFDLIKMYGKECMHPMGTDDPLGKRIASDIDAHRATAPELEHFDLDAWVEKTLDGYIGRNEKPTGITLEEESIRRTTILRRRKKAIVPPQLQEALKVHRHNLDWYIKIHDHPTTWDSCVFEGKNLEVEMLQAVMMQALSRVIPTRAAFGELVSEDKPESNVWWRWFRRLATIPGLAVDAYAAYNQVIRLLLPSENLVWPEGFGSRTGYMSDMSIAFLQRLEKINGEWCLNVTDLHSIFPSPCVAKVYSNGLTQETYEIPVDIAFWLSHAQHFRIFLNRFCNFTAEQQQTLVDEAHFRNRFTGTYTYEYFAKQAEGTLKGTVYAALSYLTKPYKYLAVRFPQITITATYILAVTAVVFIVKSIASLFSHPTSKVLHRGPVSNIVYRGNYPTSQRLPELSTTILKRNVANICISTTMESRKAQCLRTEQFVLCNSHIFDGLVPDGGQYLVTLTDGSLTNDFWVPETQVYIDKDRDLAIIFSRLFPAVRKISDHFIKQSDYERSEFTGQMVICSKTPEYGIVEHYPVVGKVDRLDLKGITRPAVLTQVMMLNGSTVSGRSGSPVIAQVNGLARLIGIQSWAMDTLYQPKVAVQTVTAELFEELVKNVSAQSEDLLVRRIAEPEYGECYPTHAFASVPEFMLACEDEHVVGDVGMNKIKPSFISNHLTAAGITTKRIPAVMSDRDPRLPRDSRHPLEHSLGKYYRGKVNPIPHNIINRAKDYIIKYYKGRLDTKNFAALTIEEAITGTREDGSNPMNLKSSPGIPFIFDKRERKGKKDYMEIDEFGEVDHIDPEFLQGYYKFEDSLSKGEVPYTRAYDFPKDELRPINKVLGDETTPPKTRSVTCMNVYYILAWRRYTMRFWSAMHRAADGTSMFGPGINPEGPEWSALYHHLNRHPNAVDFDVSNWDGFLFAQLFYAVLDIIKAIMNVKKGTPVDYILTSIFFDVMNCFIQFLNIIYQKSRGIISGFPGTAEVNTLAHILLIVCIYLMLVAKTIWDSFEMFLRMVSAILYGDDILLTIHDDILHLFNGKTIQREYERLGYTVTSATKSSEIVEAKPLSQCQFLKSSWRQLLPGYYIRVLDLEVAYDLVHWVRAKQHPRGQFFQNYMDALWICFGHGQQVFESFQLTVNQILTKFSEDNIVFSYKDFEDDYFARYLPNFKFNL